MHMYILYEGDRSSSMIIKQDYREPQMIIFLFTSFLYVVSSGPFSRQQQDDAVKGSGRLGGART